MVNKVPRICRTRTWLGIALAGPWLEDTAEEAALAFIIELGCDHGRSGQGQRVCRGCLGYRQQLRQRGHDASWEIGLVSCKPAGMRVSTSL
eukprot:453830-Heterocapsa_arctica.AAC.1